MDPSLNSLKRPSSSAPASSLCRVAPTRNTLGFSFSWAAATPGPSCSTSSSAPATQQENETSGEKSESVVVGWSEPSSHTLPPCFCRSLILLSSHVIASSLVSEASSSTTRGVKVASPDACCILPTPPTWTTMEGLNIVSLLNEAFIYSTYTPKRLRHDECCQQVYILNKSYSYCNHYCGLEPFTTTVI